MPITESAKNVSNNDTKRMAVNKPWGEYSTDAAELADASTEQPGT